MSFVSWRAMTVTLCVATSCLLGGEQIRDDNTGESFPAQLTIKHQGKEYQLKATGTATRERFFVKVYSAAHYLEEGGGRPGADKFEAIMRDDKAHQLTIKWVYSVDAAKLRDGYRDSFKKAIPEPQYEQLSKEISQFINFFKQDIKKGDVYVLRWLPGGYVELDINGRQIGQITNREFARGLWAIWFGKHSVVNRNRLASQL